MKDLIFLRNIIDINSSLNALKTAIQERAYTFHVCTCMYRYAERLIKETPLTLKHIIDLNSSLNALKTAIQERP